MNGFCPVLVLNRRQAGTIVTDSTFDAALPDEQATQRFAEDFKKTLGFPEILYLTGELGAGKTTFTRYLLHALGHQGNVKSPTFSLLEIYQLKLGPVYHLDLYRLNDPEELDTIGFRDLLNDYGLLLIEWPEKGAGVLPPPSVSVHLSYADEGRYVSVLRGAGAS